MEANELRIGNFVLFNGDIIKIENVLDFAVNMTFGKYSGDRNEQIDIDEIEPISLTEEWLLACGAIKANLRPPAFDFDIFRCEAFDFDGVFLDGFDPYLINNLIIAYKMGRWYLVSEVITWDYYPALSAISAPMEFVHTLQNYYPAFAGKELSFIDIENVNYAKN